MKSLLFRYACLIVLLSLGMIHQAAAQNARTISRIEIHHIGPPAVSEQRIRSHIRVKPGDPYSQINVDDDIRGLYGTGFFENIRVTREQMDDGVVLTFHVQRKPLLTGISIEGNEEFSDSRLMKKVESEVGEPLSERQLFADARAIRESYQQKGYEQAEVDYYIAGDLEQTGEGRAVFEINEGPKVRIDDVEFLGVDAFSQRKLRKTIKTRRRNLFSWLTGSGKLKDEQFEEDKERLRDFFREAGYIDFEIRDIEFDYVTPEKLVIRFILFQGSRYQVGEVGFEGNEVFSDEQLREPFEGQPLDMREGEIFTPQGLRNDRNKIQDAYGTEGYIDAQVGIDRDANTETETMDLNYQVREGGQSYIERIRIRGNTKTKDKVLRRELAVNPGEVFDMVRVRRSRTRLEGLNFFSKVEARPEPTEIENRKDLVITVEEKNTGNVSVGAGFSSIEQLVGFVELTQGNFDLFNPPYFTGAGQKFRVRAQIGTASQDYVMSFIEPWFLGKKLALSIDLFHRDIQFFSDEFDEKRTGGRVSLTRALWGDYVRGTVSYTLEQVDLDFDANARFSDELIAQEDEARLVSKPGFSVAFDNRGPGLFPDRGNLTKLSSEIAGGPFGGDTDYYKLDLRSNWYFPGFFEGHTFEVSGRVGTMEAFGDSERTPLFDRFYLGGLYTLRGYKFRYIGPRDSKQNEPVGGNTYWFASAEYTVPLIENLRFAIFYDIGNVYENSWSFDLREGTGRDLNFYSDDVGIGIRLNLPIGPLRLDYAFPITDGDGFERSSGRFNFGITTREF